MAEREALAIITAILITATNYEDDDGEAILTDPRERMLDAMFLAELIWDEAGRRQITRQGPSPEDLPA